MAIQRPVAHLVVGGQDCSGAEAALVRMRVVLGTGDAHDAVYATFGPKSPLDVDVGAVCEFSLGYGDDLSKVLTGSVVALDRYPWGFSLEALAKSHLLSALRVGQSYIQQTAADIVQDLLSRAEVDPGEIDAAQTIAAYYAEERVTAWRHVQNLATLAGCEVSSSEDGALNCRPAKQGSAADRSLRYGADLIGWSFGPRRPDHTDVSVVPYGAASEEGTDKWHILLREPDGGAPSTPTRVPAPVRDRDAAHAFEDGQKSRAARRGQAGSMLLIGDSAVRAGDLVSIEDLPQGPNGVVRVAEVTHVFDRRAGFCTRVAVEAVA